jgi:hypothetical protein
VIKARSFLRLVSLVGDPLQVVIMLDGGNTTHYFIIHADPDDFRTFSFLYHFFVHPYLYLLDACLCFISSSLTRSTCLIRWFLLSALVIACPDPLLWVVRDLQCFQLRVVSPRRIVPIIW